MQRGLFPAAFGNSQSAQKTLRCHDWSSLLDIWVKATLSSTLPRAKPKESPGWCRGGQGQQVTARALVCVGTNHRRPGVQSLAAGAALWWAAVVLSPSHKCPLLPLQLCHLDPTCPEGNGLSEGQQGSEPPGWGCSGGLALAGPPWGSMRLWAAEVCRPQPPSSCCPSPRAPLKGEAPSGPLTRMFGLCVRPGPKLAVHLGGLLDRGSRGILTRTVQMKRPAVKGCWGGAASKQAPRASVSPWAAGAGVRRAK